MSIAITSTACVMLLIDADNVSADVIAQAMAHAHDEFGAVHVRRAYCTPEAAVKQRAQFKALGIRPMVNLAAGKNSTDIALAVDAIDLACAQPGATMVIVSSDADFSPLVLKLREKGCRVLGIGQNGKTGDETRAVYDGFIVLDHRKTGSSLPRARTSSTSARESGRASARQADAAAAAPSRSPGLQAPATSPASPAAATSAAPQAPASSPSPAAKKTARSSASRGKSTASGTAARKAGATPASTARRSGARGTTNAPTIEASPAMHTALPDKAAELLRALPELERGETLTLRVVAERLRQQKLLSRSGSSVRLFQQFPTLFELAPASQPSRVSLRLPPAE